MVLDDFCASASRRSFVRISWSDQDARYRRRSERVPFKAISITYASQTAQFRQPRRNWRVSRLEMFLQPLQVERVLALEDVVQRLGDHGHGFSSRVTLPSRACTSRSGRDAQLVQVDEFLVDRLHGVVGALSETSKLIAPRTSATIAGMACSAEPCAPWLAS